MKYEVIYHAPTLDIWKQIIKDYNLNLDRSTPVEYFCERYGEKLCIELTNHDGRYTFRYCYYDWFISNGCKVDEYKRNEFVVELL